MANILTTAAATYAAQTLRATTKNDAVARADAEVATYCTGDWANDVDDDLIDINEWFAGTTAGGIAGNTTSLLGHFSLTAGGATFTVGDGSASPTVKIDKDDAGFGFLYFTKDGGSVVNGKRIVHWSDETLHFEHFNGATWDGLITLGNTSGGSIGFFGATPAAKPTVSGSRGGNAALADLLTELATLGLITDSSSA